MFGDCPVRSAVRSERRVGNGDDDHFVAAVAFAMPDVPLAARGARSPALLSGNVKAAWTVTGPDGKERTELAEPGPFIAEGLPGD